VDMKIRGLKNGQMLWIERIGDLAAKTGLSLHAGTTNRAPGK